MRTDADGAKPHSVGVTLAAPPPSFTLAVRMLSRLATEATCERLAATLAHSTRITVDPFDHRSFDADFAIIELGPGDLASAQCAGLRVRTEGRPVLFLIGLMHPDSFVVAHLRATMPTVAFVAGDPTVREVRDRVQRYADHGHMQRESNTGPHVLHALTPTERSVLFTVARSPDTRAGLGRRLGLATSTIDSHLHRIKTIVATADPSIGWPSTETLIAWLRDRDAHSALLTDATRPPSP